MARNPLRHAVGDNLHAIRKAQGLTQEKFGFRYGYQRSWIGRVENGRRNLTIDSIQELANRLKMDVFDLVRRPEEAQPPPPLAESHDAEVGEKAGEVAAGEEEAGEDTGEETG